MEEILRKTETEQILTYQEIQYICDQFLIIQENKLLLIDGIVTVCSDLHGSMTNYVSILTMANLRNNTTKFLFLGDYIDKGKHSLNILINLMCRKIKEPEKYFILKGNHEHDIVREKYSFYNELTDKYNSDKAMHIINMFNVIFNMLPICAVVNQKIFCVHAGIPHLTYDLSELISFPFLSQDFDERQQTIATEFLWNDPAVNYYGDEEFIINAERGHGIYYFTENATRKFLEYNGLSLIIRGHQVVTRVTSYHGDRVLTISTAVKHYENFKHNYYSFCVIDGTHVDSFSFFMEFYPRELI